MLKDKLKIFKIFIGNEVWKYFLYSILVGFLWFAIESSFLFMLQGFLFSIGLMTKEQVYLPTWYPTSLGATIFIMLIFGLVRALTQMTKNYLATLTQQSFICNQRIDILNIGLKNANKISTKEIVTIYGDIIFQSGNAIYSTSQLITVSSTVIFFLIAGLKIAPYEMLIGVCTLSVLLIPIKNMVNKINDYGQGILEEGEALNNSLLTGLKNNFLLTVYQQINTEIDKGSQNLKQYRDHIKSYSKISSFTISFPSFIGVLVLCLITLLSVNFFHTKPVQLISFFYIFLRLAQAAGEAGSTLSNIKLNFPGMKKLYRFKRQFFNLNQNQIPLRKTKVITDSTEIKIAAKNLEFYFQKSTPLFKNINFLITKGNTLVIKGQSGTGKSTLLSLILGINIPTSGEILINDFSTSSCTINFDNILGYIGPEPYFINGTIKENLLYGLSKDRQITEMELWNALELMELKSLVMNLPNQLEESIFDIPQFSTGQKQRLSFSRAIIRRPSILILDEATANLDTATENKIIENLTPLFKNCTSVIVTHKNAFDKIATHEITL